VNLLKDLIARSFLTLATRGSKGVEVVSLLG
jgi:hypothetical protein